MFTCFVVFRPFERTIVVQKDSSGHVGFVFKNGKITQIAKDTSAARYVFSALLALVSGWAGTGPAPPPSPKRPLLI